jgi:FMN phosphatase YigB (HAD superfamily)
MKPRTFYALAPLCDEIERRLDEWDALTLDIFDTVVIRRVHDPDVIKRPVAAFISRLAAARGRAWAPDKALKFRHRVEQLHRRRAGRVGPDFEARYPDFMRDVLSRILAQDDVEEELQRVTDYELQLEIAMAVPRARFVQLLQEARRRGKRIFLLSDIYLPSSHLRRILEGIGVASLADDVVSSADALRAKASGAMWQDVRRRYSLDPARWCHIGDNPISDGVRPAEMGIAAFVLRDGDEKWRKALPRFYWHVSQLAHFWKGRLVQQLMLPLEGENVPRDDLYRAGYTFFGPMLCAYIHWLAEQVRERNIGRVYFFSREGQLLHEIWKRITPVLFPEGGLPPAHYLYVSRLALAGPSCAYRGLREDSAFITFLPPQNRDFRDVCRVFSLHLEPLLPFLRRYRLEPDTPLSHWHGAQSKDYERLRQLLQDMEFQEEVRRQARDSNDALQRYLESEHFFEQKDIAVVDIGWLATIQRFLFQAVDHRPDRPRVHGFLFASAGGYPYPFHPDNSVQGFIYDHHRFDFTGSCILFEQDIFEEAIRAPHAGLMAYEKKGGGFELRFRAEDDFSLHEKRQSEHYAPLQQGVLDAASRYAPAATVVGLDLRHFRLWTNYLLLSRIAFPTTSEVLTLRHIHHLDDFAARRAPQRKVVRKLWERSAWELRFIPFLRTFNLLKHAIIMLRR